MHANKLRSIDLNLLPVLRELLRTRNVTRAAEALNMTQSAVSEALKRLRHKFDDELLVRVGRTMVATQFAQTLAPQVEQALVELEQLLLPANFDPSTIDREFVIATADAIVLALGSGIIKLLSAKAPKARIQVVDLQSIDIRSLEEGDLDLIILPEMSDKDAAGLHNFFVYEEDFACIARKEHPLIKAGTTLLKSDLDKVQTVAYRSDPASPLHLPLNSSPAVMYVPDFITLIMLVERSDAVAIVPRHLAERFTKELNIEIFDAEREPTVVHVHAYWAPIQHNDPAHKWLREEMKQIALHSIRTGTLRSPFV